MSAYLGRAGIRVSAIFIVFAMLATALPAFSSGSELPVVGLKSGENGPVLRDFVRYKPVDVAVPLSVLLQSIDETSLSKIAEPNIEFGPPESPLLVIVRVRNESDTTGTWVFSTDRGSMRYIELFEVAGQEIRMRLVDRDISTQQLMLRDYHAFAFEFSLQPGEVRLFGVVFDAESSTKLPLTIMEPRAYRSLIGTQSTIVLVATIGTLTLILLNAILFGVTGKKAFLHFVVAELALVFQAVHLSGYTTIFWFYEHAELARALSGIAKVLFALFSVRFIRSFLRTRETWPRLERPTHIFEVVCWLSIGCLVAYPFVPFLSLRLASIFSVVIVALALLVLPIIAAVAVRRYGWIYFPLVLGWAVWSIYLIYTILTVYTPLPEFPYQWRWMAPLGFFEALMLSIALGLDIRKMQQSEIRAQSDLSDALKHRLQLLDATAIAKTNRAIVEQQLRETSSLIQSGGHDSRNLTCALRMCGEVIQYGKDIDEAKKLGLVVTEVAELLDATLDVIVNGSAADSILSAGPMHIDTIDVAALLATVKHIHEPAAFQAGINIRCRAGISEITGDRRLLIRLLVNLVSNALKYTQRGTVLLVARTQGATTRFEVWDQGPGIEREQLDRLLSPERMRERLNPSVEGSGAGLGICLNLCDRMGAKLSARSTVGRGSVFRVELLRVSPGEIDTHRRVGILDDPAHWPKGVLDQLRDLGVLTTFVASFSEAQEFRSDIVIVDPAIHPAPPNQEMDFDIAMCSYENSSLNLGGWITVSRVALTKPVTLAAVLHLIKLCNRGKWVQTAVLPVFK